MKTIVTHVSVDLDAITACWLIKKYLPGWKGASIKFIPAGTTLDNQTPDENPEILHIDTGMGKFDHHQTANFTSSTKKIYEFLNTKKYLPTKDIVPLSRMIEYVNNIDHFQEVYYPDASNDRYDFGLNQLVYGLKNILGEDVIVVQYTSSLLDAALQIFKNKIRAEKEIPNGFVFHSKYGKSMILETKNHEIIKLCLKKGYSFVATKDSITGAVRIKTLPDNKYDLTPLYEKFRAIDKKATWFLHSSRNMLLNGSSKNPNLKPSNLPLNKLIEIIKQI